MWIGENPQTTTEARMEAVYHVRDGQPQSVQIDVGWFTDKADAEALAPQFPKGCKARVTTCGTRNGDRYYVSFGGSIGLVANGVNGGQNETGIKRYRAIRKALASLGITVNYCSAYSNSFESIEAFEAAL